MRHFPRTCTEVREDERIDNTTPLSSKPLEKFEDDSAYVLLGAPGAGKTREFKNETDRREEFLYITARNFTLDDPPAECHKKILFIDGLDEIRAGMSDDPRTPLEKIRSGLEKLERPKFRLSCREADWFGANDRSHLEYISPDKKIRVLRLDPLSHDNILNILCCNHNLNNPESFINSAYEKGIDFLLKNPQSLGMLVEAVTNKEKWPETRTETFDLACCKLISEHNDEHKLANPDVDDVSSLLDTTGRLCAIQLLTGHAGYGFSANRENPDYINLNLIPREKRQAFRYVLGTKLFESGSPIHRHVAEFLAGRYLAKLIRNGLPARRILALMTGYDGRIVSELRGLSSWLAAHSKECREEITICDPLATVIYGDVRNFSIEEKLQIFTCLNVEAGRNPWFIKVIRMNSRLADLASSNMEKYFREVLTSSTRDDAHQSFVEFLLETLQHGSDIAELTDMLMNIVRDNSWWPRIRYRALNTFIQQTSENKQFNSTKLKTLLVDVETGSVQDPDDELLSCLLRNLYPDSLSESDVWQHFRTPKSPKPSGAYVCFWTNLIEHSEISQVDKLLDEFIKHFDQFLNEYKTNREQFGVFSYVLLAFLTRPEIVGNKIPPDNLFNWLWTASSTDFIGSYERHEITHVLQTPPSHIEFWGSRKEKEEISKWLSENPEMQDLVLKKGMERGNSPHNIFYRLFSHSGLNAVPPSNFGNWCLENAKKVTNNRHSKEFFLYMVITSLKGVSPYFLGSVTPEEGLKETFYSMLVGAMENLNLTDNKEFSIETVKRELASYPDLEKIFTGLLSKYDSWEKENQSLNVVKEYEKELCKNRCPPRLLHELAVVYFGKDGIPGSTPEDRLYNFLCGDGNLASNVLKALKKSLARPDVPDEMEIIKLRENNKVHYLALPFLAGLEEIYQDGFNHDEIPKIEEKQLRQGLAFFYNTPQPISFSDFEHLWYKKLYTCNPDIVSDTFIKSARSQIRSREEPLMTLGELFFIPGIARLAPLPLLKTFPVRCNAKQIKELNKLLNIALLHCDKKFFLEMLHKKLSCNSMNVAQRVYWLAAGLVISPAKFHKKLEKYVRGNERRIRHLWKLMTGFRTELIERLDVTNLELLIQLMGPFYGPTSSNSENWVNPSIEAGNLVYRLIQRLSYIPSSDSTEALEKLSHDDVLLSWKHYLMDASYRQKPIRREASFHHCNVDQVLHTLDDQKPSNAADLAALIIDVLSKLAKDIRDGNTSDWRQYWKIDENNKPVSPQHEEECRNRLLSDLQERVKHLGIDAHPEGHYADGNRSDIRIICNGYNIPVEIKKSDSSDMLSGIKKQLIPKYTRDPRTYGYGIYLVFWFGRTKSLENAADLEKHLQDDLTDEQKLKISICVIDVAKP